MLCKCGCKQVPRIGNIFINGHNNRGIKLPEKILIKRRGDKNPAWKGNKVGYDALHRYIRRHLLMPNECPDCGLDKPLELCNISGRYLRDFDDWKYMCHKCHMISDDRIDNIIKYAYGSHNPNRDEKTGRFLKK